MIGDTIQKSCALNGLRPYVHNLFFFVHIVFDFLECFYPFLVILFQHAAVSFQRSFMQDFRTNVFFFFAMHHCGLNNVNVGRWASRKC
jgi:hypothetical protein